MQFDVIDKLIKEAIEVMEKSKYQIFEICESGRNEHQSMLKELNQVMEETRETVKLVDELEQEFRQARIRLTEVSRDFHRYTEDDIRTAYEAASHLQLQLMIAREKETHLRARRDELQKQILKVEKQIERAETIVSQMNVVLQYLSGDLNQVTRILESAKNRQLLGLKIILAQEEERKRIAREIHDGLAQSMANIVLRTEISERMLLRKEYDLVREELFDLKGQVRSSLEEVRKIIFNLRPMALDDLGLIPTVRKFVQDYEEKTKTRTQFELSGKEKRLPSGMEVAVFRLIQEAFSNIQKHANATFASVEIAFLKKSVKIIIKDNGIGFNVEQLDQKLMTGSHFGIMGMRERVELLEGKFKIESSPNNGTKITMSIPINSNQKEES